MVGSFDAVTFCVGDDVAVVAFKEFGLRLHVRKGGWNAGVVPGVF